MSEESKVAIVTEANGRERRYNVQGIGIVSGGWLVLGEIHTDDGLPRLDNPVVTYAPGEWRRACEDGVEVPDDTARKFATALHALREIDRTNVTDTNEDGTLHKGVAVLKELARQALDDIEDDL